ncbi:MAG: hypothetical protein Q8O67_33665 [Deltaproteobacteria bacterium]|nr:hypothetical protein [Deltaproteobacteria bacterium]
MIRCLLGLALALLPAATASATPLALDRDLLVDTGILIDREGPTSSSSSALPLLQLPAAQTRGAGGPPAGPPMLSGVGLGLQVGFPTALTLKIGGAHDNGLAFGIGAGWGYRNFAPSLSLHGDYQLHLATLVRNGDLSLTGYIGPGLWLALFGTGYGFGYFGNGYVPGFEFFGLGVRCSLGLSMAFSMAPVELYLELTPAVFVFPGFDPGLGWSLGFRYYF